MYFRFSGRHDTFVRSQRGKGDANAAYTQSVSLAAASGATSDAYDCLVVR